MAKSLLEIILRVKDKNAKKELGKVDKQLKNVDKSAQKSSKGIKNFDKMLGKLALGGGLELAMGCDFRIASTKARFGQPEVSLGMIPGYAGTQRLPRLVGLADALYLLMTADMINAEEALRIGLVQKVVEPEQLMDEVMKIAKVIMGKGPEAIKKVKHVARTGYLMDFDKASDLEADYFGTQFKAEGEEGMRAFLEKRKPNW